jgi:acetylornithine deacetylase/succinyl-diaminopimelate desuccinylase-like protein
MNGFYYGRGATDNKGPIMSEIFAVKELVEELRTQGGDGEMAMANVAFIYEGEEESASAGLQEVLNTYRSWLCQGSARVAGILISNTTWVGDDRPCLTYGMRGSIDLSVTISGPGRDLHSGVDGGAITEPMIDLLAIMGGLVDSRGMVLVPNFYEGVRILPTEEEEFYDAIAFDPEDYRKRLGVKKIIASTGRELLDRRWSKPTLSIIRVRNAGAVDKSSVAPTLRWSPPKKETKAEAAQSRCCWY